MPRMIQRRRALVDGHPVIEQIHYLSVDRVHPDMQDRAITVKDHEGQWVFEGVDNQLFDMPDPDDYVELTDDVGEPFRNPDFTVATAPIFGPESAVWDPTTIPVRDNVELISETNARQRAKWDKAYAAHQEALDNKGFEEA